MASRPGQLGQIPERQLVLLLHKFFGSRRVGILQPAIRIGDLDAVIIVHLIALGSNRVIELGNATGAQNSATLARSRRIGFTEQPFGSIVANSP